MKLKIFLLLLAAFTLALFPTPQEESPQPTQTQPGSYGLDYSAGLNLCFNRVPVLMGENNLANTLIHSYLALEVEVSILDFLRVGALAGFDTSNFADPVDFFNLPLSLRNDDQTYNSMVFGIRGKADLFSWRDFSFNANAELLFFKLFKKENTIDLPVVTGASTIKQSFSQIAVELLVQYDGLSSITIFAGPQLNLLKGNITALETIEDLQGEEKLSFKQKNTLGFAGGVNIELGSHFDLDVKISLFAKTSLSAGIFYIF